MGEGKVVAQVASGVEKMPIQGCNYQLNLLIIGTCGKEVRQFEPSFELIRGNCQLVVYKMLLRFL